MTFAAMIFGCFAVLVGATFVFALIVYLKEYSREAEIVRQYEKNREQDQKLQEKFISSGAPIYVVQPPKKKKAAKAPTEAVSQEISDKAKKNLN